MSKRRKRERQNAMFKQFQRAKRDLVDRVKRDIDVTPLLTSCDFTNGCTDATCAKCYPPPDPRDAEERSWRAVWSTL